MQKLLNMNESAVNHSNVHRMGANVRWKSLATVERRSRGEIIKSKIISSEVIWNYGNIKFKCFFLFCFVSSRCVDGMCTDSRPPSKWHLQLTFEPFKPQDENSGERKIVSEHKTRNFIITLAMKRVLTIAVTRFIEWNSLLNWLQIDDNFFNTFHIVCHRGRARRLLNTITVTFIIIISNGSSSKKCCAESALMLIFWPRLQKKCEKKVSHDDAGLNFKTSSSIEMIPIFTHYSCAYRSYSVSLDESRKPLANGFESIFSLVINWFWYAVTAVNTVSGKTNVLWSNSCSSFGVVGIFRPGYKRTKCIRGWYRCIEFNTIWNEKKL